MLKQRDCVLYDTTKNNTKSNAVTDDKESTCCGGWPHRLQPQFHVWLMRLVLDMERHRTGDVRDLSLTFFQTLARDIVHQIEGALIMLEDDTKEEKGEDYFIDIPRTMQHLAGMGRCCQNGCFHCAPRQPVP